MTTETLFSAPSTPRRSQLALPPIASTTQYISSNLSTYESYDNGRGGWDGKIVYNTKQDKIQKKRKTVCLTESLLVPVVFFPWLWKVLRSAISTNLNFQFSSSKNNLIASRMKRSPGVVCLPPLGAATGFARFVKVSGERCLDLRYAPAMLSFDLRLPLHYGQRCGINQICTTINQGILILLLILYYNYPNG